MNFSWQRRHWGVFVGLLVCQVFGMWALWRRGALVFTPGRTPMQVPTSFVWMYLPAWITGSAFLTSLILVKLFDTAFPKNPSGRTRIAFFVVWLLSVLGGIVVWRLIR